jgi:hypothetical protein
MLTSLVFILIAIGKYWLKKYDNRFDSEYSLCQCSDISGVDISSFPLYYKKVIESWNFILIVYSRHAKWCFMTKYFWKCSKGEMIHRMYRNRDYFGDGSVHDTWRPLTIQMIWCSFFEKKVVLNFRFLLLVII